MSRKEHHPHHPHRLVLSATDFRSVRQARGAVRTCVPARDGQSGYREPAEADPDSHIVRGED